VFNSFKEVDMLVIVIGAVALCMALAAVGLTALMAYIPLSVLEQAQQHGRFAELGSPEVNRRNTRVGGKRFARGAAARPRTA
jgi:hypothetical protein